MPSKTPKQAKLMRAVAHGWKKPGGGGPSVKVAKEFVSADKVGAKNQFKDMPKVNRQSTKHGKLDLPRFKKRGVK